MDDYAQLKTEEIQLLSSYQITDQATVDQAIKEITPYLDSYRQAGQLSIVPAAWIAAVDFRESDCSPMAAIGQGDPWNKKSVHVPAGEGPFASKAAANKFYLHYDDIDAAPPDGKWDAPYAAFMAEKWNGFGPRMHGRHSGYLWSGTSIYTGGMYTGDGVWSSSAVDPRAGTVPIIAKLGELYPDLLIAAAPSMGSPRFKFTTAATVKPIKLEAYENTAWLQDALNQCGAEPRLRVDNNFDYRTRRALREFQKARLGLRADGKSTDASQQALIMSLAKLTRRS